MELIRETKTINVPKVYGYGKKPDGSYLMLDFVAESPRKINYWQNLGNKLADLHKFTNDYHGLHFNNYVGALAQNNEYMTDGIAFYIEKRLKVQVGRAMFENKIDSKLYDDFQKIYKILPNLLPNEKPALLHGDLWSGNLMVGADGHATLVDPSAYFGLREADIAFSTLFGGFNVGFYEAYNEAFPLEFDFKNRIDLYNLYPLLVHVNLFGGGYLDAVKKILKKYV
jgi:protein-ribulosamine 3-kinase